MSGRIVRENGLLIADYDVEVGYRIWNKLHQRDVDIVRTEESMNDYFEGCASTILPDEPFAALWEEVKECYSKWHVLFSGSLTSMIAPNAFEYRVIQMAVVGPEFIRFFCAGEEVFKIRTHRERENLMSLLSSRNVSLYSAKAKSLTEWTAGMEAK